jgi:hypothetical protein
MKYFFTKLKGKQIAPKEECSNGLSNVKLSYVKIINIRNYGKKNMLQIYCT